MFYKESLHKDNNFVICHLLFVILLFGDIASDLEERKLKKIRSMGEGIWHVALKCGCGFIGRPKISILGEQPIKKNCKVF